MKPTTLRKALLPIALLTAANASADLIVDEYATGVATPEVLGGWHLTDLGDTGASNTTPSSISSSAMTGSIDFKDNSGFDLQMNRVDASQLSWWNNPESSDNEVFTTDVPWVQLILPENTRAISFNVGASFNGWGYMLGYDSDGYEAYEEFHINPSATPGFGIYSNNCNSIGTVIIDPHHWGVGNISIAQSTECSAEVPEPGVVTLLGLGLAGLAIARRRQK